jgi:hypothetical protein
MMECLPFRADTREGLDVDTENSIEEVNPSVEEPADERNAHSVAVYIIIVLASVILLITSVNVWVDRAALNTDNWVAASDQLLADPAVREAVSTYAVDQLYANVDVGSQLADRLPDNLSGLATVLAAQLRAPATEAVNRLLASDQGAAIWSKANRVAHEKIVAILKDETNPAVSTAGGVVTIDVREIIVQLGDQLGLPGAIMDRIPADAGQVTVIESQKLADLQSAVKFVQWASVLLFVLVVAMYIIAVVLADGWRRVATRSAGISITIVGLLLLAGLRFGGDRLLDQVVKKESNRAAANAVWRIGSSLLKDIGRTITVVGVLIILGAVLVGSSSAARAVRRLVRPLFVGGPGLRWGIGAAVFLVLVMWAPIPALTNWFGILTLALVLAACVEGFRRVCLADGVHLEEHGSDTSADGELTPTAT